MFQLKENNKNEVYCCNLSGQIFKIHQNHLDLIYQTPADKIASNFHFFFDKEDNIIAATHNTIEKITPDGIKIELFNYLKQKVDSSDCNFYTVSQTLKKDIYFPISKKETVLHYYNGHLDTLPIYHVNKFSSKYFSHNNSIFSICVNGNINFNVKGETIRNFEKVKNERLFQFNSNELIGLDAKKGIRILKFTEDSLVESHHFFDDLFASACYQSKSGTLFIGTFGEGVRVITKKYNIQHTYNHLFLGIAASPKNDVFLTTRGGEVFKADTIIKKVGERKTNIDAVYYINGDFKFNFISQKNILYSGNYAPFNSIKDVHQIDNKTILISNYNGIYLITSDTLSAPQKLHYIKKQSNSSYLLTKDKRFNAVTYSKLNKLIYYATNFGVFSKHWSSSKIDTLYYNNETFIGNSLQIYNDHLICGTEDKGILFYKGNKQVMQLNTQNGLYDNNIKKIKIKDQLLYILSSNGIQVYDLELFSFYNIGFPEGIINKGISNFALSNDKLWLLEKHRYYSIPKKDILNKPAIDSLYFDSIVVNNKRIDYLSKNDFKNEEHAFIFYFDYRNLETKGETQIEYQLDGFSDWETVSATQNKIDFKYLPEGNYTFKIRATYRGLHSNSFTYSFSISPPIWKRWWFVLLSILFIFSIIALVVWYRFKQLKKKNTQILKNKEFEKNAIDAQLKAIRAQMNPHFIFNSINSIQDLVLKQETIKSYDYLVEFSKLVRNTLDFSEREFITLEEELEFLGTYLSLEKLRFEDDFTYAIKNNIQNESVNIPSLIIQPFIENALKHGLLHKDGKKTLDIEFSLNENLICKITDNGVGRTYSKTINTRQNKSHISFSTRAIQQRMLILNEQFGTDANYSTRDIVDKNGEIIGTEVIVTLPIAVH